MLILTDSRHSKNRRIVHQLFVMVVTFALLQSPAAAYDEVVHQVITADALGNIKSLDDLLQPPDSASLDRFRLYIYEVFRGVPEFSREYPQPQSFDPWAFKKFLGLNPEATVFGIDKLTTQTESQRELIARAARQPDEDHRNQSRFAHDRSRNILRDAFGEPLPEDPATLEIGGLRGLSSQAHAHYQLPRGPKSEDFEVLKSEPWRFALPAEAHSFGLRFAQRFFLLSLLACSWKDPANRYYADLFLGHATHYAQDSTMPLHTVQVGLYDFFVNAKMDEYIEDARSMGGVLYRRPTLRTIGTGIINNYHVFAEKSFTQWMKRMAQQKQGQAGGSSHLFGEPDAETTHLLAQPLSIAQNSQGIMDQIWPLVERSAHDGPKIYRLAYRLGDRKLSRVGFEFGENQDPARFMRHYPGANADLDSMNDLQRQAASRGEVITLWLLRSREAAAPGLDTNAVAGILARDLMNMEEQAALRRATYVPSSHFAPRNYWVFAAELLLFAVVLWFFSRFLSRWRKSSHGVHTT